MILKWGKITIFFLNEKQFYLQTPYPKYKKTFSLKRVVQILVFVSSPLVYLYTYQCNTLERKGEVEHIRIQKLRLLVEIGFRGGVEVYTEKGFDDRGGKKCSKLMLISHMGYLSHKLY